MIGAPMGPRPEPVTDGDSARFWQSVDAHAMELQSCSSCGRWIFYPRVLCPHCHSEDLIWGPVSGRATIYSFTVSRRPAGADFVEDVPYVVALVDLEEGVRMMSNIETEAIGDVRIGSEVSVRYRTSSNGVTLPIFALAPDDGESRETRTA